MAAPPFRKFLTICSVTARGYALTPRSATP